MRIFFYFSRRPESCSCFVVQSTGKTTAELNPSITFTDKNRHKMGAKPSQDSLFHCSLFTCPLLFPFGSYNYNPTSPLSSRSFVVLVNNNNNATKQYLRLLLPSSLRSVSSRQFLLPCNSKIGDSACFYWCAKVEPVFYAHYSPETRNKTIKAVVTRTPSK